MIFVEYVMLDKNAEMHGEFRLSGVINSVVHLTADI